MSQANDEWVFRSGTAPTNLSLSDLQKSRAQPVRSLLGVDAPEGSFAGNLKNDDAVVIVNDTFRSQDSYDLRWGPRCLNDPDGLKRPAIINRSFKG